MAQQTSITVGRKAHSTSNHDVGLIVAIIGGMLLAMVWSPLGWLRLPLALPFVLYLPGYGLTSTAFARQDALSTVERNGIAIGLSLAIITLIAPVLSWLGVGIGFRPILVSELLVIAFGLVGMLVRRQQLGDAAYAPDLSNLVRHHWLTIGAALLLCGAVAYTFTTLPTAPYTEFYILQDERVADYPRAAVVGEPLAVDLFVVNREQAAQTYRYEIVVVDSWGEQKSTLLFAGEPFDVAMHQTYTTRAEWQMPAIGDDQQVLFHLYLNDQLYRELSLWINVDDTNSP
ncbi:MAG: DUF1616 domain-containing protein [Candidatus Promineifilaceae bacterium]